MSILFVNACARPDSRTKILADYLLQFLSGELETLDLYAENILPLNYKTLQQRDAYIQAGDYTAPMFRYARQFAAADEIVFAAPYWDLSIPAMLKIYLENITVSGLVFRYAEDGHPIGMCKTKRLFYVMTAGGTVFEPDYGFGYIKALSNMLYEIPEVICFKAENLDIIGADVPSILERTKTEIQKYFSEHSN